nr:MAG: ORF1 [Torque teno midi virus]
MPFWWKRRRRWWSGRRRPFYRRRFQTKTRRKPRRRFRRPKYRRAHRRRRNKTRRKVRRKLKKIPLQQWQPDKIVKCKIKGIELFLLGAQGKQFACFATDRDDWTPSRNPGGGGFTVDRFTLQSLYTDYTMQKNIWTKSNVMLDLCRYTGCKIILYRHQHTDFIVSWKLQGPFDLDKYTYCNSHPYYLMLHNKYKIVPSRKTKPLGKNYIVLKIKPPKLLQTKWYFQEPFSKFTLLQLTVAACNFSWSYLPPTGVNQQMSFYILTHQFYQKSNWGDPSDPYNPIGTMNPNLEIWTNPEHTQSKTLTITQSTYADSISYNSGWFTSQLLKSYGIKSQNVQPISAARYNPILDNGKGNAVWLSSVLNRSYDKPTRDKDLIIEGKPLWQLLYGFFNFVQQVKKDTTFLRSYICVIQSPALYSGSTLTKDFFVPIDMSFIKGNGPFDQPPTIYQKSKWFPTLENQLETINNIVQCGPYIPKYSNERESNWQLSGKYCFYFKWGGTHNPDEAVANPEEQGTYITPTNLQQAIQIINPEKQIPTTIFHSWDYRRGALTKTALKRIREDQETDTDFQTDAVLQSPKKKKVKYTRQLQYIPPEEEEIQESLLELCKESTYQETQDPQTLYHLIQQQQHQQRDIKLHLLKLISDLKKKQCMLQLQTGMLN